MTEDDFKKHHKEWSDAVFRQEPLCNLPRPIIEKTYTYLYKEGRGTPKAQFFMTYSGGDGDRGFWCPRSAIISDDNNGQLVVADWCKLKEMWYT